MRGLLFTCRPIIDTTNINRNTKKTFSHYQESASKEKGNMELIKPIDNRTLGIKKRMPEYYQEGNEHMEKGEFSYLLFHFIRFTWSPSAYHTPSQPAFSAFRNNDFNCFLLLISSLIMVLGH